MKIVLFIILILVLYLSYQMFQVKRKIALSGKIVAETVPYQETSDMEAGSLLVLGDSTAYGVGASTKEESIPALVAQRIGTPYVENRSFSGARVSDLAGQLAGHKKDTYDTILVQIGGNDIVARNDERVVASELEALLKTLPKHDKLVVLMCGDVGVATLFPWFVRGYYTRKTLAYHEAFAEAVPRAGGTYVNLYEPKEADPFVKEPEVYLAKDEFHPSSAGYQLWFRKIEKAL
jgi:lysophospholipase L1-like esterase